MNKTWITLIVIALLTVFTLIGYNFYLSISGQNVELVRNYQNQIVPDLGTQQLEFLEQQNSNIVVNDEDLNHK